MLTHPPYRAVEPAGPLVIRIPLLSADDTPAVEPPDACRRCGSRGFSIHQRVWKRVKDPQVQRAQVVRFLCKRCGHVRRGYPVGISASRQSRSLYHLSVLLYWIGLSYQSVRAVLGELGCALSTTSIRRNVQATRRAADRAAPFARLRLAPTTDGILRGPDGLMALRLVRQSPTERYLEAAIAPGPRASELSQRLTTAARSLAPLFGCAATEARPA